MNDTTYTVARSTPRFAFIAEAEISGMRDSARVSELSATRLLYRFDQPASQRDRGTDTDSLRLQQL